MATVAELKTKIDAAVEAMGDADWNAAITALLQAKSIRLAVPDVHAGEAKTLWREMQGDTLIEDCRRQQSAATQPTTGGLTFTKTRFTRVSGDC